MEADFGDTLLKIRLPDSRKALLRVVERLDTVFLATGRLEDGWEAACHRADAELDFESEEAEGNYESSDYPMCRCLEAERPNVVHRCDNKKCGKRLLCESQYDSATEEPMDRTLCMDCRSTERLDL